MEVEVKKCSKCSKCSIENPEELINVALKLIILLLNENDEENQ